MLYNLDIDNAVAFAPVIQNVCNANVAHDRKEIFYFLPMFSSLMEISDDDIDKFITTVHGANSGRGLAQKISILFGVIIHLKALRFE